MIKEAECSLKIPQTFCQVHTERSVLSVCLDQDCPYRGMFCYQCIKFHYQHLDKTFEIKEFLNLINENINDLSFNMLPTSPSPSLKDIYKNKFDQLYMNRENLLRQKELVIEAVCKYVDLAIENAENKVETIENKNPASQDTQSIQELTTYQDKFFDLANLQSDELYDLLIYFSKFIHKEDDKIEIVNFSPSNNGQIPKNQAMVIENDLDNTCQNLRNSELVLQKLTGILDHLPPDDRSAHQKLSCLKVAPQQTPRRFGQPVTFQPNYNANMGGGSNSAYHHNSISLSNHFQRASQNQNNNNGNNSNNNNNINNQESNHHTNHRSSHFNNGNSFSQQNSGQNSNKFTQPFSNSNNSAQTQPQQSQPQTQNATQQNKEQKESNNNNNANADTSMSIEIAENSGSGASSFMQKFQQLKDNNKNNSSTATTTNPENSQSSNNSNSTAVSSNSQQNTQSNQNANSTAQQQNNSNKQAPSNAANLTKLQNLVNQQNAQMAANQTSQHTQGFHSLAQHFQTSTSSSQPSQNNGNGNNANDMSRMSYQQKKLLQQEKYQNQKRNEVLSEQRLALRSVEHFCDALEVGYNTAWCVSFRTQRECALNGIYHMPIFVYDSTVGSSLESAILQLSLYEGSGSFTKKLYEQSVVLKKTNKTISSDETNLMNVLEKININTSYKLRRNSDYTIVVRNKTSEQEDESSLKQLYILYGDDQADEIKSQPESEGSKMITFIKTNTGNLSSQLENAKLITSNNDSLEDPQLSDYFIPYLSISQLTADQQHFKSNFYSSSNAIGAEGNVLQNIQDNEQKTPKRLEYENNHLGNLYNNNNQYNSNQQSRGGYKDFNGFKSGFSNQNGNMNNNSQENDYNKYNRNNQDRNKRKYLGSENSSSNYNSSRSNNNGNSYGVMNQNSSYSSSSYQNSSSNNNYEKSSIIPGFIPQKKQKK